MNETDKQPLIFEGWRGKVFGKIRFDRGDWRFFQKQEALTLSCVGGKLPCLEVSFFINGEEDRDRASVVKEGAKCGEGASRFWE